MPATALAVEVEATSFWSEETAAVALEVPMPSTKHGWSLARRDLETYLGSVLKKKNVEVYELHMDHETKHRFHQAKMTEVRKFITSKGLEALPPEKKPLRP